MENRYKVVLSGDDFYQEVELPKDMERLTLGTDPGCDVRVRKTGFFEPVQLDFLKTGDTWSVFSADNLFFNSGGSEKLSTRRLRHGDVLYVYFQASSLAVFQMEFLVDFQNERKKFERQIDISANSYIQIGAGAGNHIVLQSQYAQRDTITLERHNGSLVLVNERTQYGVYHNGIKVNLGAVIQDTDFLWISDYVFYFKGDALFTEIRPDMLITLPYTDNPLRPEYPKFTRNTRIKTVLDDTKIEILDPPNKPEEQKENWFMRLMPSMSMLVTAAAMAVIGGGRMIVFSAISGIMAIVTSTVTYFNSKKDKKESAEKRVETYRKYIEDKQSTIEEDRLKERLDRENLYIPIEKEKERIWTFDADLFDRVPTDADFLCLRLGSGAVKAAKEISYKKQEKLEAEDDLALLPEQTASLYGYIQDAPVVCDLKEIGALGVVGAEADRYTIFKNMLVDLAARQYYTDVRFLLVAGSGDKEKIHWARLLPHVWCDEMDTFGIVTEEESRGPLFEHLFKELSSREESGTFAYHIIVFFYDDTGFKTHPISRFLSAAKDLGVTFVFFKDRRDQIPVGCQYIVDIEGNGGAKIISAENRAESTYFYYPTLSDEEVQNIAFLLAPVFTEEISLESSLTKNYSMFQMLNILAAEDLDLKKRWSDSRVTESMAAPIGISKTGIITLDLSDRADGPHGLVAGTTGSGKSEILQTYILAMATLFHPYEVGFVIIDFKGGGMVNQLRPLPHLIGAITNIDGKEIDRSLKSIKAELEKRQRCFAEADVNHIDKYIAKFKDGQVKEPLPHLIIIVDEFAELRAEQPEFMKELISAARIGRSLGVHLILATQKPSGQVDDQIWSNSRFKLCLKVQSQSDSNEVLKSPLAAEIREPGRAYLQVGNNEKFELFQSAYSGAAAEADAPRGKEFSIDQILSSGKRRRIFVQKRTKSDERAATQLDVIVQFIQKYCESSGIRKLPDICLPSLETLIPFRESASVSEHITIDLGIYDDPDQQIQEPYPLDLTASNVMMIGSVQTGKTNALQTIIRSLSTRYSPEEVNIYIIDFASMVLKNFESLAHVGGVVTSSEDEKLKNLFKLILEEIETRKEKLMQLGVSSFAAYKEAGRTDLPQIILMIDNLTALRELYLQDQDDLLLISREGLAVGVSVVIANSQTAGIGYRYLSNFAKRIALFCNDSGEYSSLFDHCRETLENIPGRGLIVQDNRFLECQIYLAFEGEKEIDRVTAIRQYIKETNRRFHGQAARRIPVIPELLTSAYVDEVFGSYLDEPFHVVAGLDYASVMPFELDFSALNLLAVSGADGAGRHNFIHYVTDVLRKEEQGQLRVYVIDGPHRRFDYLRSALNTAGYSLAAEDAAKYVCEIENRLKTRYEAFVAGNEPELELNLLILEGEDAIKAVSDDRRSSDAYKNLIGKYRSMGVAIIILVDNLSIPYSAPDMMKTIRDTQHLIFFDDLSALKLFDVPMSVARQFRKPISLGDGYYMREGEVHKLKTPLLSNDLNG